MVNFGPGPLPRHLYCHVESWHVRNKVDRLFEPCVWFGLVSHPGRAWGCHIMLECGAVYRNVPLHALASRPSAVQSWMVRDAQTWDCYGYGWAGLIYPVLDGLRCEAKCGSPSQTIPGEYLFTVAPVGDGYSAHPEQAKEFVFARLDNGRYTAQPTNRVLFRDPSFTTPGAEWPTNIATQTVTHSCERVH